jgi:hypothetical protein
VFTQTKPGAPVQQSPHWVHSKRSPFSNQGFSSMVASVEKRESGPQ